METTAFPAAPPVPTVVDDLQPDWLSAVLGLGPIVETRAVPFGDGSTAQTVRLHVTWDTPAAQPSTFVVKLSSTDDDARQAAARWRSYEVEACFYQDLARFLPARLPHCHWSGFDPDTGSFALVLEDVDGTPGDQLVGCGADDAALALAELAGVHGARWADPALARIAWLNRYPTDRPDDLSERLRTVLPAFLERYGDGLSTDVGHLLTRFVDQADGYDRKGRHGPRTISHGDFRNENLLFGGGGVCILDWQAAHYGAALHDVGYFLGTAVPTEHRRHHEEELLRGYWDRLHRYTPGFSWDDCWTGYRHHAFSGIAVALISSAALTHTARMDALLLTMTERAGQLAIDHDADRLLTATAR